MANSGRSRMFRRREYRFVEEGAINQNSNFTSLSMAKSFDSLVRTIIKTRTPHRLLCVFVETKDASKSAPLIFKDPPKASETACWIRVCSHAHMLVTDELTFALLMENADRHDSTWSTVIVAGCHNQDRSIPSAEDAERHLAIMREKILEGDRSGLAEFGRDGRSIDPKPAPRRAMAG